MRKELIRSKAAPPPIKVSRVLTRLDVGDFFGGGADLLPDEQLPTGLGAFATSDVKVYAIAIADLTKRASAEQLRQIREEVGNSIHERIARKCLLEISCLALLLWEAARM